MRTAVVLPGIQLRIFLLFSTLLIVAPCRAASNGEVQDRLDRNISRGEPIVVHIVVALCDNDNQGIVPVSRTLGNGQDPAGNLYWGAAYGVRTYLLRTAGWKRVETINPGNSFILERTVFHAGIKRGGSTVPVYIVADAWDGAQIRKATQAYLGMASGRLREKVAVTYGSEKLELDAGASAHLVAYVGHDGLMDFSLDPSKTSDTGGGARSAVVLACRSKSYFLEHLRSAGAHPLLLTTGLMAPEAYTLDAAIRAWIEKRTTGAVIEASAAAYHRYQKCGLRAARRLFWGEP